MDMNRYEKQHAIEKIKGYIVPRSNESQTDAFNRAQNECIAAYERQIQCIRAITQSDIVGKARAVYASS